MSMPIPDALDRARRKAYIRLIPLLLLCYMIAYVDRTNISIAALPMTHDLPGFNNDVIGTGAGIFFLGYFILAIPGTLLVEKWSARRWISVTMIAWGIVAAATAFVHCRIPVATRLAELSAGAIYRSAAALLVPLAWLPAGGLSRWAASNAEWLRGPVNPSIAQFYGARFLLGLAEAGFFPGVIVYLTHWFPSRDRSRALSWFLIATPIAMMISPKLCNLFLPIGTTETIGGVLVHHPRVLCLTNWQWIFVAWGLPAVVLGVLVFAYLTDRPGHAGWLEADERDALEAELKREKAAVRQETTSAWKALANPRVLLLAAAYLFVVTGNYGVEIFLPTILKNWYHPSNDLLTWVLMIPPLGSLMGQLFVGWSSDHTGERRLHTVIPIICAATALGLTARQGMPFWVMVLLFTVVATGLKAYLPAFWSLPSLFLTEAAAAGSIGLINCVGNLGGFLGPKVLGYIETKTGSFVPGILILVTSMSLTVLIILLLGLGRRAGAPRDKSEDLVAADPLNELV
jgi:ACS family tartrate transporter-like MFS transporter